jgi:prephenate dehydrogenase
MSGAPFEKLAIIGLGLLGGSVALAAREAGLARRITGAGRRRAPLEAALAAGVVDEIGTVEEAVAGADLVVVSTPVGAMRATLEAAAPHLSPGTIVTDVGSVKAPLADMLPGILPQGVHYVGAHPMAGSHEKGVEHARSDLFRGACCVLTPIPSTDPDALERVQGFWEGVGARAVLRSPSVHDDEVAWVSHVPHVLAFAFAHALGQAPPQVGEMAGSGFRDFTRIANSDAELWGEILSSNTKALVGPIDAFKKALGELAQVIEHGDAEAQERFLSSARESLAAAAAHSRATAHDRATARTAATASATATASSDSRAHDERKDPDSGD